MEKEQCSHFKVIVDTREQKNHWITRYFDNEGIPWEPKKLEFGDYAIEGYENVVAVERKANLTELSGNFTNGRERFKREFERAKEEGAKIYLLVENCTGCADIMAHRYRTKFRPKAFLASIRSWEVKGYYTAMYNPNRDNSGELIYKLLSDTIISIREKEDDVDVE